MKKTLIFKCEGANRGFVHVYLCERYRDDVFYEVMRNRRKVPGCNRWRLPSDAVKHAVRLSLNDVMDVFKDTEL